MECSVSTQRRSASPKRACCHPNEWLGHYPEIAGWSASVAILLHKPKKLLRLNGGSGRMRCITKVAAQVAAGAWLLSSSAVFAENAKDLVLRNPSNSVHIRIHDCGKSRCGTVVWANAKAKADSARGGTPNLVGVELFREFREVSPKVWKGKVFVPDLNKVFTGTGTVKDANTIVARGCLFAGVGCKSQTWTRVR
jgi:uncharacterized protein (DUF2147 family)